MPILTPSYTIIKRAKVNHFRLATDVIALDGYTYIPVLSTFSILNINRRTKSFIIGFNENAYASHLDNLKPLLKRSTFSNPRLLRKIIANGYEVHVPDNTNIISEVISTYDPCSSLEISRIVPPKGRPSITTHTAKITAIHMWSNQIDIRRAYCGMILLSPKVQEILGDRVRILRTVGAKSDYEKFVFIREADVVMLDIHDLPHFSFSMMRNVLRGNIV